MSATAYAQSMIQVKDTIAFSTDAVRCISDRAVYRLTLSGTTPDKVKADSLLIGFIGLLPDDDRVLVVVYVSGRINDKYSVSPISRELGFIPEMINQWRPRIDPRRVLLLDDLVTSDANVPRYVVGDVLYLRIVYPR